MQNDDPHPAAQPIPEEHDIRSIRKVISDSETFQNDLEGFTQLPTEDVIIVNIAGRRVSGKDVFHNVMKASLKTPLAEVLTTTEVEDIRFLRPDVALASCVKHISDQRAGGTTALSEKGSLTFTLVREQGTWLIASAQTTPIST